MNSNKKTYNRGDELLKKFISGSISGQEKHELQLLAEEDPFLQDALQGYKMDSNIDHHKVISEIKASKNQSTNSPQNILKYAATGIILISAGIWLFSYLTPDHPVQEEQIIMENSGADKSDESFAMKSIDYESDLSKEEEKEEKVTTASSPPASAQKKEILEVELQENAGINDLQKHKNQKSSSVGNELETPEDPSIQNKLPQAKPEQKTEELAEAKSRILKDTLPKTELDELITILNESVDEDSSADSSPSIVDEQYSDENIYHITGKVLDEDDEPLIGANLLLQGTEFGSSTDLYGNFELDLPTQDGTLEIHYVGFESVYIPISEINQQSNIVLSPSNVSLDEVVITAQGSKRRNERNTTNSSGIISGSEQIMGYPLGGFSKFEKYLKDNKVFPDSEKNDDNHGEVELQFLIKANGQLDSLEVIQSLGYILDKEAIRLLQAGPKWRTKPKGKAVRMKYRIRF